MLFTFPFKINLLTLDHHILSLQTSTLNNVNNGNKNVSGAKIEKFMLFHKTENDFYYIKMNLFGANCK